MKNVLFYFLLITKHWNELTTPPLTALCKIPREELCQLELLSIGVASPVHVFGGWQKTALFCYATGSSMPLHDIVLQVLQCITSTWSSARSVAGSLFLLSCVESWKTSQTESVTFCAFVTQPMGRAACLMFAITSWSRVKKIMLVT